MFRGIDVNTGEWVYGYLIELWTPFGQVQKYAIDTCRRYDHANNSLEVIEVHPSSIAMKTGQKDKNDKKIYGSIEINGKMTKGGDKVKFYTGVKLCGKKEYRESYIRYDIETASFIIDSYNIFNIGTKMLELEITDTQWESNNG